SEISLALSHCSQSLQRFQIYHVLREVVPFWCFQHFRDFAETRALHDQAESVQTDPPLANMLVSIYSRTAACLRIVYVNRNKTIGTDDAIEFTKGSPHA